MKKLVLIFLISLTQLSFSQTSVEKGDPTPEIVPDFYKGKLSDIENEISALKIGKSEVIATSPGNLPVHAIYYGEKEDFKSQANFNSAVGSGNVAHYARKDSTNKPVVFFVGPVHGQEAEGIVGLVNLIHIAETGKDHRGIEWPELKEYFNQCRVIIIPCGNPDGRKRCPYDSFVGLPAEIMTKYGQGTKKDGSLWRWRGSKSTHPMKGDVGILGAYFNDNGVNIMHDEFFFPMADETKAILKIAYEEAPDISVVLHSYEFEPTISQNRHAPTFMRKRITDLSNQLNQSYTDLGLPHKGVSLSYELRDSEPLQQYPFNLTSALYYISGSMAFTYECTHGTIAAPATYNEILDAQLVLYREMFDYILNNRLYSE